MNCPWCCCCWLCCGSGSWQSAANGPVGRADVYDALSYQLWRKNPHSTLRCDLSACSPHQCKRLPAVSNLGGSEVAAGIGEATGLTVQKRSSKKWTPRNLDVHLVHTGHNHLERYCFWKTRVSITLNCCTRLKSLVNFLSQKTFLFDSIFSC